MGSASMGALAGKARTMAWERARRRANRRNERDMVLSSSQWKTRKTVKKEEPFLPKQSTKNRLLRITVLSTKFPYKIKSYRKEKKKKFIDIIHGTICMHDKHNVLPLTVHVFCAQHFVCMCVCVCVCVCVCMCVFIKKKLGS